MKDLLALIMNTSDAVVAVDSAQRLVLWNQAAEALFGFKATEVLGRFCYDVIGGREESCQFGCQKACSALMRAMDQQVVPTRNLLVQTKSGQEIWISVTTITIPSRWRDLCVLIHLCRDISRQKEMEHLLQQFLACISKLRLPTTTHQPANPPPSANNLTDREQEILKLLAAGNSTKAIAARLYISASTVRNHIHSVLMKLGVQSRLEAAVLALRSQLI
jgi:PAS domain S-box-containing protein